MGRVGDGVAVCIGDGKHLAPGVIGIVRANCSVGVQETDDVSVGA